MKNITLCKVNIEISQWFLKKYYLTNQLLHWCCRVIVANDIHCNTPHFVPLINPNLDVGVITKLSLFPLTLTLISEQHMYKYLNIHDSWLCDMRSWSTCV